MQRARQRLLQGHDLHASARQCATQEASRSMDQGWRRQDRAWWFIRHRQRIDQAMAVTHPTLVRTALADFVVDQLDEGTPPGHLVIQTSGGSTVATLTFSATAFGAASSGTAT